MTTTPQEAMRTALNDLHDAFVKLAPYDAVVAQQARAALSQQAAQEPQPVARILHWHGPAHWPVPHGGICARTFEEFPKGAGEKDAGYWREGAPLTYAATPAKPAEQEKPRTLREAADGLIEAGHEFWSACRRDAGGGAVRWLDCSDGTLIIFTRGEYRDTVLAGVHKLPGIPTIVFSDDGDEDAGRPSIEAVEKSAESSQQAPSTAAQEQKKYSRAEVQKWRNDIAHAAAKMVEDAFKDAGEDDFSWLADGIRALAHKGAQGDKA